MLWLHIRRCDETLNNGISLVWRCQDWSSPAFYSYITVSVELLSKLVTLISMIMQLPWSATIYLTILATVNGLWHSRQLAPSLPNWSRIDILVACCTSSLTRCECVFAVLSSSFSLSHLLSFCVQNLPLLRKSFQTTESERFAYPSQREVLPLHGSFRFMRTRPDGCPHWPCQGSKHASVIRANSYWMALH